MFVFIERNVRAMLLEKLRRWMRQSEMYASRSINGDKNKTEMTRRGIFGLLQYIAVFENMFNT